MNIQEISTINNNNDLNNNITKNDYIKNIIYICV